MILDFSIITERLILRNLDLSDIGGEYLSWMSDPEVLKYLEARFCAPKTIADLKNFVIGVNASDDEILLGIFLRNTQRHIGNIKLGPCCMTHHRADIGFIIGLQVARGKGYATEAIMAVSKYALCDLKLSKITAGCYSSNKGSARALISSGFFREGKLYSHVSLDDGRDDVLLFGLTDVSSVTLGR